MTARTQTPPQDSAVPPDERLTLVAELARSHEQLISRAVKAARQALRMDVAFVADTRGGEHTLLEVPGDGVSLGTRAGASGPLEGTYCQLVLEGRLGGVIADTRAEP